MTITSRRGSDEPLAEAWCGGRKRRAGERNGTLSFCEEAARRGGGGALGVRRREGARPGVVELGGSQKEAEVFVGRPARTAHL